MNTVSLQPLLPSDIVLLYHQIRVSTDLEGNDLQVTFETTKIKTAGVLIKGNIIRRFVAMHVMPNIWLIAGVFASILYPFYEKISVIPSTDSPIHAASTSCNSSQPSRFCVGEQVSEPHPHTLDGIFTMSVPILVTVWCGYVPVLSAN